MTKGQRIKLKREQHGISQVDLSKHLGILKQTLYKYENDIITNIPSDIIEKMAVFLHCTPGYIMGWENGEIEMPKIEHPDTKDRIMKYAELLSKMDNDKRDNVMQYIDFLTRKDNEK